MAIPPFACDPVDPMDLCCTVLYDTAAIVADHVVLDLLSCIPEQCGPDLEGFVAMGRQPEIPYVDSDYVVVSLQTVSPSPGSRDRQSGKMLFPSVLRATYLVRFVEAGYVLMYGGDDKTPPVLSQPSEIDAMSLYGYSHGWAFYRSLLNLATASTGRLGCNEGVCYSDVSDLVPIDPEAGLCGWQSTIKTEINVNGLDCTS